MYSYLNYEKMFLILVSLWTAGTWNINQGVLITYRTALLVVCHRNRNCCLWLQFSSLHAVTMENWNQPLLCTLNDCRGILNPSKNYFHIQTSLQIKLNPFDIFFCNFFCLFFVFVSVLCNCILAVCVKSKKPEPHMYKLDTHVQFSNLRFWSAHVSLKWNGKIFLCKTRSLFWSYFNRKSGLLWRLSHTVDVSKGGK